MTSYLTKSVMDKIVAIEKRQIWRWRVVFWAIVGLLLLIVAALLIQSWQTVQERGTLDLLTLFGEDREIMAEFWQDTLTVFWEELPQRRLFLIILVGTVVAGIFIVTKKTRKTLRHKTEQLKKYTKPFGSQR